MSAPHPFDPDYGLWCELNACQACDGLGEDYIEDDPSAADGDFDCEDY